MTALDNIAHLLHQHCGFGKEHLSESVLRRMAEGRSLSLAAYHNTLQSSRQELQALVEALVVPETYFFRHPEAFTAMRDWIAKLPRRPVRILSIACSTGEEPYSIAMSLLLGGMAPKDFRLEAWDLSSSAIATATKGCFSANSFRGSDLSWRAENFTPHENRWQISDRIKRLVSFRCGNLFDLRPASAYDIIFCRKVLIYFSAARQQQALHEISRALADDGILFLGPAEPPSLPATEWRMTSYPMSFSCVKRLHTTPQAHPATPRAKPRPAAVRHAATASAQPREQQIVAPVDLLEKANTLADRGRLSEARKILQQALSADPENPKAHFLLGIVEEAAGEAGLAEASYRKAIYLDPSQLDALQHMVLLLERQGRKQAAEQWRRRATKHAA